MHWKGGGKPRPPPQGRPAYAQPRSARSQVPSSMAFVTDSNRPQALWQPPPTACLTASEAASEAPASQFSRPTGGGGGREGVEQVLAARPRAANTHFLIVVYGSFAFVLCLSLSTDQDIPSWLGDTTPGGWRPMGGLMGLCGFYGNNAEAPPPPPRSPGQRHGQQPRLRDGRPPE